MKAGLRALRSICLALAFLLCFAIPHAKAQLDSGIITGITPGDLFDSVTDRLGNKYAVWKIAVNDTLRCSGDTFIANNIAVCSSGYFRIFMEPGCGMEDDADTAHMARRDVLCRVLYDLSQFIKSPLTSNGGKINIWVRDRANVPGGSSALAYGTSFYMLPELTGGSGIVDNTVWSTLHTGADVYANFVNKRLFTTGAAPGTAFHAILSFDFGSPAWHSDLTTSPSTGEYDLYTVALREMAHALGIVSEIAHDGTSLIGGNYFARYDKFLTTHSGIPLIVNSGTCSLYNYTFNPSIPSAASVLSPYAGACITDSTKCDTAVKYIGSTTLAVYTPNCYETGYSLSNFEDECITGSWDPANGDLYYAVSNETDTGTMKRYLKPAERLVLCDLGYAADTIYGDTTNLNYHHYGSTACSGIAVAGAPDGFYPMGGYIYTSNTAGTIQINGSSLPTGIPGILDNDINADSFRCLQVVYGTGTVNATAGRSSTDIFYTPGSGETGAVILRYVPMTLTGEEGGYTIMGLLVSDDPDCPPTNCDLIVNGNFSIHEECGVIGEAESGFNFPDFPTVRVCHWDNFSVSADLYTDDCDEDRVIYTGTPVLSPTIPLAAAENGGIEVDRPVAGTNFIGMAGGHVSRAWCRAGFNTEAMMTRLAAPLIEGGHYVIDFWARVANNPGDLFDFAGEPYLFHDIVVKFYASVARPARIVGIGGCDAVWNTDAELPSNLGPEVAGGFLVRALVGGDNEWRHFITEFTYDGPGDGTERQWLVVMNQSRLTGVANGIPVGDDFHDYVFIADVKLTPKNIPAPDVTVCPGIPTMLTPNWLEMDAGFPRSADETFTWSPGTGLSCTGCATPLVTTTVPRTYTVENTLYECADVVDVTVFPLDPITGPSEVCLGSTIALSNTTASGGVWSVAAGTLAATVGSSSGVVTGLAAGTAVISFTSGDGCITTKIVTVRPLPAIVVSGGSSTICIGATVTMTGIPTTGTWSGGGSSTSTVSAGAGAIAVTATSIGMGIFTYTLPTGCMRIDTVDVNTVPDPILGLGVVCAGSTITLSNTTSWGTGTWSSSTTGVATIGVTSGIVYGVAAGTTTISYLLGGSGCLATTIVTVNPTPSISGGLSACMGAISGLSPSFLGGDWSSGTTAVATVNASTGVVYAVSPGVTVITYLIPSTGCYATATFTVHPLPAPISGTPVLCEGDTYTLSDASAGGTWSSGTTGVATIGSTTGVVFGVSGGTSTISYTLPTGCQAFIVATVNPLPDAITGPLSVCVGFTVTLVDATAGGTWSSSSTVVATIDPSTGIVSGARAGTSTISYTLPTGCFVIATMTVNPNPAPIMYPSYDFPAIVCTGTTLPLTDDTVGGIWSSTDGTIAVVDASTGIVTGMMTGTVTISYTLSTGCYTTLTVEVSASPLPITGDLLLCIGEITTLSCTPAGGVWSGGSISATVLGTSTGAVIGSSGGTSVVTYTLPSGCTDTAVITVFGDSVLGPITGLTTVCIGSTITLFNSTDGGTWSTTSSTIATIDASGVVTGVSGGTAPITYTKAFSCGTVHVYFDIYVLPPSPPITGNRALCTGIRDTLYCAATGGTWSSSDPAVATVDPTTGEIGGVSTGAATISYIFTGPCGTDTVTAFVTVNAAARITTNFIVACHAMGDFDFGDGTTEADTGCILVCDSTVVRYYAHGSPGSAYGWTVTGGIIMANYGDSVDVLWPFAGTLGRVTLHTPSRCTADATLCVQVISSPRACFTVPETGLCLGELAYFTDCSVGDARSRIVSWRWDFGDGSYSTVAAPPAHAYTASGEYTAVLVVTNECNCTDTARIMIGVGSDSGPDITCVGTVCDSETVTYNTSSTCPSLHWEVIGGTIVSGGATPSTIKVRWDNVGAGGMGIVRLFDSCSYCDDTTMLKVPVVLANAPITGNDTICTGHVYEYKLPLWAGTDYAWGVLGKPDAAYFYRDDHKFLVRFDTAGTYTIHARYQDRLKFCGGNVTKTITVLPATTIIGDSVACANTPHTYRVGAPGTIAYWELSTTAGVVTDTLTNDTISVTFTIPGTYRLTATGPFCSLPHTITVPAIPHAIDTIHGADTVCMGRLYSYQALPAQAGTICLWEIDGGTLSPAEGMDLVTAIWAGGGSMQLRVKRVSTTWPYCEGPQDTLNIFPEIFTPDVTGDTAPCPNSYRDYSCNYNRGEAYSWAIYPNTVGSVMEGNFGPDIKVLWNDVPEMTAFALVVTVQKCDTVKTDTLFGAVFPLLPLVVTGPDTVCHGAVATFSVTPGESAYAWDFGDEQKGTSLLPGTSHVFGNPTADYVTYRVNVSSNDGPPGDCSQRMGGFVDIVVRPGPPVYITASPTILCHGSTSTLTAGVPGYGGGITYQWHNPSGPISGATNSTYVTTSPNTYACIATTWEGCQSGNAIALPVCPEYDGEEGGGGGCAIGDASWSEDCARITLYDDIGATGHAWTSRTIHDSFFVVSGSSRYVDCPKPGVYQFLYRGTRTADDSCLVQYIDILVGAVPDFKYRVTCKGPELDTIFLTDITAVYPTYTVTGVLWAQGGGGTLGTGSPLVITRAPGGGTITIIMTVSITRPDLSVYDCNVVKTITLFPRPVASYTYAVSPICEGIPIQFTNTSTGTRLKYLWNFGDFAYNRLEDPERTYEWIPIGNPRAFQATLTILDSVGCTDTEAHRIDIYQNDLGDVMDINGTICASDAPYTILFSRTGGIGPFSYLWSNTATTSIPTLDVYESGAYYVTVTDAHQCRYTPVDAQQVNVIQTPPAVITGQRNYCDGETVHLSGYAGSSVTYEWRRNGTIVGSAATIADAGLPPGAYGYRLTIGSYDAASATWCYATTLDTVHIHALPAPPVIGAPVAIDCGAYHLQLTSTATVPGTFNWSNGTYGATTNIFTGGHYRVWFTDTNGCGSHNDVTVPYAPNYWFPYFPSGCYNLCVGQIPLKLYGPPHVTFTRWAWMLGGFDASMGMSSAMAPYDVMVGGSYQWDLDNGLCRQQSAPMDITFDACDNCQGEDIIASVTCDTTNPASFDVSISLFSHISGATYTIGTDIGPMLPFSGTLGAAGWQPAINLVFTTLTVPPPASIKIKVLFTFPDGSKCYYEEVVLLPPCHWVPERSGPPADTAAITPAVGMASALLVFPNPASGQVTISYDYGTGTTAQRQLYVYDALGRKMTQTAPQDAHGNWLFDTRDWAAGIYLIRMEAAGKALHSQRMVVSHD